MHAPQRITRNALSHSPHTVHLPAPPYLPGCEGILFDWLSPLSNNLSWKPATQPGPPFEGGVSEIHAVNRLSAVNGEDDTPSWVVRQVLANVGQVES